MAESQTERNLSSSGARIKQIQWECWTDLLISQPAGLSSAREWARVTVAVHRSRWAEECLRWAALEIRKTCPEAVLVSRGVGPATAPAKLVSGAGALDGLYYKLGGEHSCFLEEAFQAARARSYFEGANQWLYAAIGVREGHHWDLGDLAPRRGPPHGLG